MHSFCGCLVWGLISIRLSYHLHFPSSHRLCYNCKNESIYRARLQNESINPEQNQGQIPSSVVAAGEPTFPSRRLVRAGWKHRSCSRHQQQSRTGDSWLFGRLQMGAKTLFLFVLVPAISLISRQHGAPLCRVKHFTTCEDGDPEHHSTRRAVGQILQTVPVTTGGYQGGASLRGA